MARLREIADGWEPGQGRPDTIRNFVDRAPACETMAIHVANARVLSVEGGCAWVTDWDETDTESYSVKVCTNPWAERYFRPEHVGYAWTFQANYTDPYFTNYGECILVSW